MENNEKKDGRTNTFPYLDVELKIDDEKANYDYVTAIIDSFLSLLLQFRAKKERKTFFSLYCDQPSDEWKT